jgi:hypothetical protein
MDSVWIIVGMLAAFAAGAWVRQPFYLPCKAREKQAEAERETQKEKDRKAVQISNLLSYTAHRQEDEDLF